MRSPARAGVAGVLALGLVGPATWGTAAPLGAAPQARPMTTGMSVPGGAALGRPAAASIAKPSRILLTPTADPATSQVVSWTTPRRQSGQRVQFRVPGERTRATNAVRRPATTTFYSGTSAPRYAATLSALRSGTRYQYRIVTRGHATAWHAFTTATAGPQRLTIIGLGDTQVDNLGVPRSTIRRALADEPAAAVVLQAGDVVDRPYRGSQWSALFGAMGSSARTRNWLVAIGNHEQCVLLVACRSRDAQAFRSYFDWPTNGFPDQGGTWFHTDLQGVRIVVLDSFGGRMAEQAWFLDQALASNPNRWAIVLMHAPPFATRPGRSNDEVRQLWLPIIEARGVDLVLSGHDHSYARGQRDAGGPVFAVSVSGPKYYPVTDADWVAHGARPDVWAAATSTYQVITVDGDRMEYRAVVSHRGSASTAPVGVGGELDRFTIVKDDNGRKVVE